MMKPILLVSAIALAAPALAQSTTGTTTGGMTQPNSGMPGTATNRNDTVAAPDVRDTTSPSMAPGQTPLDDDDDDDGVVADHSAMGHSATGTDMDATSTMGSSGTTGGTGQTAAGSWDNSAAMSGQTMANWNFGGDWGEIGSAEWGVGAGMSTGAMAGTRTTGSAMAAMPGTGPYAGVGGPIDVASQWAAISPSGQELTPLEFGLWMLEQNGKDVDRQVESTRRSRASNLPAVQVLNVTAGALAQADTNRDWRVSQSELQAFVGM